jgi:hypothetical protein
MIADRTRGCAIASHWHDSSREDAAVFPGLRIASRQLAKGPAFILAAAGGLAVGIGATRAIFSTAEATIPRPLRSPDPGNLDVDPLELSRVMSYLARRPINPWGIRTS